MIELEFFLKGLLIGLTIAAPVGPVGILCLRRTLTHGRMAGLASGLGAAFADTFYGILAVFGLSIISDVLICCLPWFEFFGAVFLLILGINTYFKKLVVMDEPRGSIQTLVGYFTSTFFLTLTNPVTMFAFLAIFSAIGYTGGENLITGSLMLFGVFLGSMIWWLLIGEGTSFFRKRMSENLLLYINKFAGLLLMLFGLIILINWIFNL